MISLQRHGREVRKKSHVHFLLLIVYLSSFFVIKYCKESFLEQTELGCCCFMCILTSAGRRESWGLHRAVTREIGGLTGCSFSLDSVPESSQSKLRPWVSGMYIPWRNKAIKISLWILKSIRKCWEPWRTIKLGRRLGKVERGLTH